jgi:putative ABC transport system permease protein
VRRSCWAAAGARVFPDGKALGQRVRLGDSRFMVSGVLAQGESMGFNSDEIAIIPIDYAQELFNTESLFRIPVEARSRNDIEPAKAAITTLKLRHDGEEDVTVITRTRCSPPSTASCALTLGWRASPRSAWRWPGFW